jgi:hypothetical protein
MEFKPDWFKLENYQSHPAIKLSLSNWYIFINMVAFLILLLIVIPLSVRWVRGTDYQKLDLFDDEDKNMVW